MPILCIFFYFLFVHCAIYVCAVCGVYLWDWCSNIFFFSPVMYLCIFCTIFVDICRRDNTAMPPVTILLNVFLKQMKICYFHGLFQLKRCIFSFTELGRNKSFFLFFLVLSFDLNILLCCNEQNYKAKQRDSIAYYILFRIDEKRVKIN